jgi:hypothetical protein
LTIDDATGDTFVYVNRSSGNNGAVNSPDFYVTGIGWNTSLGAQDVGFRMRTQGGVYNSPTSGQTGNFVTVMEASHITGATVSYEEKLRLASAATTFSLGGTERMRITSAGNVGIGTTSPASILHLQSAAPVLTLRATSSSTNSRSTYIHWNSSTGSQTGFVGFGSSSNDDFSIANDVSTGNMRFRTNTSDRMTITSAGNVGIGTTSPSSRLHVSGGLTILTNSAGSSYNENLRLPESAGGFSTIHMGGSVGTSGTATNQWSLLKTSSALNHRFEVRHNASAVLTILTNGNVGIGTTAPSQKLHINGPSARLFIQDTAQGAGGFVAGRLPGEVFLGNDGALPLAFLVNNTERMRIAANGTVLVGTTNTSGIDGNTKIRVSNGGFGGIEVLGTTGGFLHITGGTTRHEVFSTGGDLLFRSKVGSDSPIERMRIDSAGNVGIGTSSGVAKLDVNGGGDTLHARFGSTVSSSSRGLFISTAFSAGTGGAETILDARGGGAGRLTFQTDSTNRMVITSAGNVGIGTTSPAEKLHIAGNVRVDKVLLSNQENLDVDSGALRVIATIPSATYDAAFFDFVIKKGTNRRAGTLYAVHNGTTVEFTETSTNDIGDTGEVVLSADISGGNIRLLATTITNDWIIKTLVRGI